MRSWSSQSMALQLRGGSPVSYRSGLHWRQSSFGLLWTRQQTEATTALRHNVVMISAVSDCAGQLRGRRQSMLSLVQGYWGRMDRVHNPVSVGSTSSWASETRRRRDVKMAEEAEFFTRLPWIRRGRPWVAGLINHARWLTWVRVCDFWETRWNSRPQETLIYTEHHTSK